MCDINQSCYQASPSLLATQLPLPPLELNGAFGSVILEKGKARLFQDGNPIIYGGAITDVFGDPKPGDEVNKA